MNRPSGFWQRCGRRKERSMDNFNPGDMWYFFEGLLYTAAQCWACFAKINLCICHDAIGTFVGAETWHITAQHSHSRAQVACKSWSVQGLYYYDVIWLCGCRIPLNWYEFFSLFDLRTCTLVNREGTVG